ncbi:MAG: hypothetical protein NWE83_03920 [Candidatus Bathyarchaeota archaeon]|nr:hypothetical protein [Candidatus Bathyarchaeota archaeon]
MNVLRNPEWLPHAVNILTYPVKSISEIDSRNILDKLHEIYGGTVSGDLQCLDYEIGGKFVHIRWLDLDGGQVLVMAIGSELKNESLNSISINSDFYEQVAELKEVLTVTPDSMFQLNLKYFRDKENAKNLLQQYLEHQEKTIRSAGFIKDSLIVSINTPAGSIQHPSSREIMILSYNIRSNNFKNIIWNLCFEVVSLASYIREVNRLYSDRRHVFDQLEALESSTQIRINEILAEMVRPVNEIQPTYLGDILKEISIQYSRLSNIASSTRRDRVKAQSKIRKCESVVKKWQESQFEEYLTNTSIELDHVESMIAPFGDYIERTEALMTQLNTVLDSVKTYLGIKQQMMSLNEETSSKEQLIRLVNLQEILHKLEILIVAVYLTEMAKIIFEAFIHEHVSLLTAIFIPIALVISIIVSRLLHKEH